jgi:signal transduction histidine kinase
LRHDPVHFAQLVSLACHDLRTPLATAQGFAKTLLRAPVDGEQSARWLGMIDEASAQMADLLDDLSLVARIQSGRYEPVLREADSFELARAAAERLDPPARVSGDGALVETDPEAAARALAGLARCALRHGGLDAVELAVAGAEVRLAPVPEQVAPILLGEELQDLGAAVGTTVLRALGGDVAVSDGAALVTLSAAAATAGDP